MVSMMSLFRRQPPALLGIDLGNTDLLATELQHGPIYDWFSKKQIKAQANLRGVDTSETV